MNQRIAPRLDGVAFIARHGESQCRTRTALALVIALAIGIGAPVAAAARSYYVDVVGGDDVGGDGTSALPLRTVAKASKLAQAGDTVQIKGGSTPYDEGIVPARGGSSATAPIRYVGYGAEPPRFVNLGTGAQPRDCIGIYYLRYVIVENVVCDGGATPATGFRQFVNLWASSYNQVINAEYRGAIQSEQNTMIVIAGDYAPVQQTSTYNQIRNVRLAPSGTPTHGVAIHRQSSHNLVEGSRFVMPAHHLVFQIMSSYNVIRNNDLSNPNTTTMSIEQPTAAPSDPVERNVIEDNRFFGTGGSGLSNAIQLMSNRSVIRNNVFYDNAHSAIAIGRGPVALEAKYLNRNRIYHNVFYRNVQTPPAVDASYPYAFRINISCPTADYGASQDNALVNNIFYRNDAAGGMQIFLRMGFTSPPSGGNCDAMAAPPRVFGVNGTTIQNNSFLSDEGAASGGKLFWVDHPKGGDYRHVSLAEAESQYAPYVAHNVEVAPAFVAPDAPARDFRLSPSSPLIDRGRMLTSVAQVVNSARTRFVLQDATFFSGGNGIVRGDTIQFVGSSQRATITTIDYATNQIEVSPAQPSVVVGAGVSLPWNGAAPDIGAFETEPAPSLGAPGQPLLSSRP